MIGRTVVAWKGPAGDGAMDGRVGPLSNGRRDSVSFRNHVCLARDVPHSHRTIAWQRDQAGPESLVRQGWGRPGGSVHGLPRHRTLR